MKCFGSDLTLSSISPLQESHQWHAPGWGAIMAFQIRTLLPALLVSISWSIEECFRCWWQNPCCLGCGLQLPHLPWILFGPLCSWCPVDHRAWLSLGSWLGFLFFAHSYWIIPAQPTTLPLTKGLLWGGRGGGLQRCSEERVQWTLLRATVMSNGAGLWEPALGGPFVVKHERAATYHCAFSHQRTSPPASCSSQPPPGRRRHIPSLSIDEEGKWIISLFKDSQNQSRWQLWWSHGRVIKAAMCSSADFEKQSVNSVGFSCLFVYFQFLSRKLFQKKNKYKWWLIC